MTESMKDYEKELEASMRTIEEGDILTGSVISVDEKEVILDLKYYAEGVIPAEYFSREPGFSLKENVQEGDEISATVIRKDDGNGNILLSRVEAVDVLAWDKLKELKETGAVLDVVVKGITNAGVIAYVEDVRGFIRHEGKESRYTGYWKVYGDVTQAKQIFQAYDDAKECAVMEYMAGKHMSEIAC